MRLGAWRDLLTTYLRPHRKLVGILAGSLLATIALQIATPQIVRIFIDRATSPTSSDLGSLAAVYIGAVLAPTGIPRRDRLAQ